jgi:hypothetical protein
MQLIIPRAPFRKVLTPDTTDATTIRYAFIFWRITLATHKLAVCSDGD